ncbi:MAG: glucosamine-6-phosphate deaminase [Calditrichae bacterium]|nr:glucosamine-6-phosphate deaminase [Calditrichia bacterium]
MSKVASLFVDKLNVNIYPDRKTLGKEAAISVAGKIRDLLSIKDEIRMIFAAAPSQNEVLEELINMDGIDWTKITGFHMDEYIGLALESPQRFGIFLREKIFNRVPFKQVHYIQPKIGKEEEECSRYSKLLQEKPIDIICMGIGENGHIAFNDPPVADFNDLQLVKVVELDEKCRQQQVNDGCFKTFESVPKKAITLTVPMLFSGENLFVVVPGESKARAIFDTLMGSVSNQCPASILRNHSNAHLYIDKNSASLLNS